TRKWSRSALDTTINHLVSVGKIKILSRPKLVCLSGKEAEFVVGGQYPIVSTTVTATAGTSSSSTEFKDYGITLKIKPVVKDEENIQISISNEITEIDSSVTVSNDSPPAFSTRNTKTELYLRNEQSLVMSGLIKNTERDTVEKFPGLGELPILGMLFRSKDFQNKQTELVIILTPSIEEGSPVFKKKDHLEKKDLGEISGRQRYPERVLAEAPDADEEAVNYLAEEPAPKEGIAHYLEEIKAKVASSLTSSRTAAREFGYKGTLKLRLRIFSDGTLKDISVLSSSGSELVDSSAIFAIKNLAPFPSFPLSVERKELSLDIPVVFN
ncbi:MAG TPA: TonB family protein, partial [Candidatus Omnitrophota bacterium]|nr:TonB family protein [Candidatus Omnitrophota bacterium]